MADGVTPLDGALLNTSIGLYGVLARRSAVLILMSIELMLNAVNINLIGFAAFMDFTEAQRALGQVLVIFVITIAAAELALAVAIILRLYRNRSSVNVAPRWQRTHLAFPWNSF